MKKYLIIILSLNLIFFSCGKSKNDKVHKRKIVQENIIHNSNKVEERGAEVENEISGKVYIVQEGDTVWSISEKIVKQRKGNNYTAKDVGNMFYRINKLNFKNYPGGVNDNLKVGDKILIPQ